MSKRKRDFKATLEPQLKQHVRGDNKVDSFAAMLAASRAQPRKDSLQGQQLMKLGIRQLVIIAGDSR
ncbi:hypothetical protein WJX77_008369 [Trebouxia sp. C0004]